MQAFPQVDTTKWTPPAPEQYAFININANVISQSASLENVLKQLHEIHRTHKGKTNIIHIGDSHIQADEMTRVLRHGFQNYFGDAGRGLVFPQQLAGSNAPHDVHASSNVTWRGNRLTNKNSSVKTGVSGFGIQTEAANAAIRMRIQNEDGSPEYFNQLRFFLGKEGGTYRLSDSNMKNAIAKNTVPGTDTPSLTFTTDFLLNGFELTRTEHEGESEYSFYGVSLELTDTPGVLYHTIGVNGATYNEYADEGQFWEQLTSLHGDLFIISMGTNEAQSQHITEQEMTTVCDLMVQKIHHIAPGALVLITTPAGSFYHQRRPNAALQTVANALVHYCAQNKLPCWDLYNISGGKKSPTGWKQNGFLGHDLVHYNDAGYRLQGLLLLNALAKAYNDYKPPVAPVKKTGAVPKPIPKTKPAGSPAPAPKVISHTPKIDTMQEAPKPRNSKIKVKYEG